MTLEISGRSSSSFASFSISEAMTNPSYGVKPAASSSHQSTSSIREIISSLSRG